MENEVIQIPSSESAISERLDKFLADNCSCNFSRSYILKIINQGLVSCGGNVLKASYRVKADDVFDLVLPKLEKLDLSPQDIPLDVVYQDSDIAVINKPAGLIVHPGAGAPKDTLINALLYHLDGLSSIGGVERPGIVHRLDRDTAGLMVIAKNDNAHISLSSQFEKRTVSKVYTALVKGKPRIANFIIENKIERHPKYRQKMTVSSKGRLAKSEITVKKVWDCKDGTFSLLKVRIFTGRTHQIRVHLSSEGLPIIGDSVYSKSSQKYRLPYLLLASVHLGFDHPVSGDRMEFDAELPEHFLKFIEKLDRSLNGD
ncbi:MAG TPA: RluA family pseudouridine synthase [Spirochaetota bacterium]|nr:RluA family pseudouridine synthase [Spirochaetota bacterium]